MLEYKARLYGREFYRISRFAPASQVCSIGTHPKSRPDAA